MHAQAPILALIATKFVNSGRLPAAANCNKKLFRNDSPMVKLRVKHNSAYVHPLIRCLLKRLGQSEGRTRQTAIRSSNKALKFAKAKSTSVVQVPAVRNHWQRSKHAPCTFATFWLITH
ncbi:hypothetical protein M758_6G162900 [Ceratodon purpureus]|nr:hypothetical protein M758_6G162900 [Ceratodon purpureus]